MIRWKPILVLVAYSAATAGLVPIYHNLVHTPRIFQPNDVIPYVVLFCLFILIPLIGLIHLSFLTLNRQRFGYVMRTSIALGCFGPVIAFLEIVGPFHGLTGEYAILVVPIAFFSVCAGFYCLMFIYFLFKERQDRQINPSAVPCSHCGYDLRGAPVSGAQTCPECGALQTVALDGKTPA